jgi:hypothetical protein
MAKGRCLSSPHGRGTHTEITTFMRMTVSVTLILPHPKYLAQNITHIELDGQYRYWSFMEAHPAHTPISAAAHAEATDVLTWSYTGKPNLCFRECLQVTNLSYRSTPTAVSTCAPTVHSRRMSGTYGSSSVFWRSVYTVGFCQSVLT